MARRGPRCVSYRVVSSNGVLRQLGADRAVPPELIDEIGSQTTWIEKPFEFDRCQLLKFGFRVIRATLLSNARANLPHDLLDVHRIGSDVDVGHLLVP